ncbi:MAG: DUF2478 domain-containing protein [Xanthobacteraceae bacterium]|nr:DUF2478 domain-containing protein [Xanthobacteraceae bacterium]QYK44201.1 MAG: DUF2478 domain-containing protein [Xanthobacteraceae bacterium]
MTKRYAKKIAAVQGAATAEIQGLFRELEARWRKSAMVVGVIEDCQEQAQRACGGGELVEIPSGRRHVIYQSLGRGSDACCLDPAGVVTACESIRRDIRPGCDLVVLSKFGKLEIGGSGLTSAFVAAIEIEVPILTSVAPMFQNEWDAFAAPYYELLPPDAGAIDNWWRSVASHEFRLAG